MPAVKSAGLLRRERKIDSAALQPRTAPGCEAGERRPGERIRSSAWDYKDFILR